MGELELGGFGPLGDIIWRRPEWLNALWLLLPVILLRLLRRPAPILRVPLLGLWERAAERSPERFGGLLRWLGILLDLLLVAGAIVLAAGPARELARPPEGLTVIVVDASAGSAVRGFGLPTLLERSLARAAVLARRGAQEGKLALLWARNGALELGAAPGDLESFRLAARSAPTPSGSRAPGGALADLLRRLRGSGRVYWVGAFAPPGELPRDERFETVPLTAPDRGAGLSSVRRLPPRAARPGEQRIRLRVTGEGQPRELRWTVAGQVLSSRQVQPTAGGEWVELRSSASAALRAGRLELLPSDPWPLDDSHPLVAVRPRRVAVRFADSQPEPPRTLLRWVAASDRVSRILGPADRASSGVPVLNIHLADDPERSLAAGAHLVLGARRAGLGLRFGEGTGGPYELEVVRPELPLLRGVQPGSWLVRRAYEAFPAESANPTPVALLRSGDALLMARAERPDRRAVWWGMGPTLRDGSWPLMPIFPLMLDEAAAWAARLAPLGPDLQRHFDPGEMLSLEQGESPRALGLEGVEVELARDAAGNFRAPSRPGRYALLGGREIAVGATGLAGAPGGELPPRSATPRSGRLEEQALASAVAPLLLILLLARLCLRLVEGAAEGIGKPLRQRGMRSNA